MKAQLTTAAKQLIKKIAKRDRYATTETVSRVVAINFPSLDVKEFTVFIDNVLYAKNF